ncbi:energy transducer TonB [Trinickia sp. Y13]|uniref:energy transducer TonB n=1 Tax=Trinickia sp. Y13 TaxID=2917807 RepID=UPI0024063E6E|nr:energy transducer TonB [Trinickia sp. Y13]MDG0026165.1 energy transducer TonB [Trinickia sp. Y13]
MSARPGPAPQWQHRPALVSARATHSAHAGPRRAAALAVWGASVLVHGAALIAIVSHFGEKQADAPPLVPPVSIEVVAPAQPNPSIAHAPIAQAPAAPAPAAREHTRQTTPRPPRPPVPHAPAAPAPLQSSMPSLNTASTQPAPATSSAPAAPSPASAAPAPPPEPAVTPPIGYAAYLNNPPPRYPQSAQEEGWEGRTVLRVHVDASGHPIGVQLHVSSGHDVLDKAALAAVRQWTFVPAKRGATPIDGWVDVPLDFRLN